MKIKALHIEPQKHPQVIEISKNGDARAIIGECIEYEHPFENSMMFAIDGAGKIYGRPVNRALRNKNGEVFDIIAGDFLIIATRGGEMVSMSPTQIAKYTKMFMQPETIDDFPPEAVFNYYGQFVSKKYAKICSSLTGPQRSILFQEEEMRNWWKGETFAEKHIAIPEDWAEIPEKEYMCRGDIESVEIPLGVEKIGNAAFLCCKNLVDLKIPESVIIIEHTALQETAWYDSQPDGVVYAGRVAYSFKGEMPANAEIALREGTVSITGEAFRKFARSENLESLVVTIPKSVEFIDSYQQFWNYAEDFRDKVTIRCEENSFAHAYAKENKIKVELISE